MVLFSGAASQQEKTILFLQKAQGTGMGGQSVEDMERVIAAMRRVVERLQTENDNLKKHPASGQTQHNDLMEENKKLKVSVIMVSHGGLKTQKYNIEDFLSLLHFQLYWMII